MYIFTKLYTFTVTHPISFYSQLLQFPLPYPQFPIPSTSLEIVILTNHFKKFPADCFPELFPQKRRPENESSPRDKWLRFANELSARAGDPRL